MVLLPWAQQLLHWKTTSVKSSQALYAPPALPSRYNMPWQFDARMKALMGDMQMIIGSATDNQNSHGGGLSSSARHF